MTVGGAICGYCAIGNLNAAAKPDSTIIIESTEAKIGRVIKKRVKFFIFDYLALADGLAAGIAGGVPKGCGLTGAPGRILIRLSAMT